MTSIVSKEEAGSSYLSRFFLSRTGSIVGETGSMPGYIYRAIFGSWPACGRVVLFLLRSVDRI